MLVSAQSPASALETLCELEGQNLQQVHESLQRAAPGPPAEASPTCPSHSLSQLRGKTRVTEEAVTWSHGHMDYDVKHFHLLAGVFDFAVTGSVFPNAVAAVSNNSLQRESSSCATVSVTHSPARTTCESVCV